MNTQQERIWSPQQRNFIDWAVAGRGSCVLEAVAGAGKSTVLFEAGRKMPGQVAYMAFNKKIVDYLKFSRAFNAECPGFETDIHGLVEEAGADGKPRYFADCVRRD